MSALHVPCRKILQVGGVVVQRRLTREPFRSMAIYAVGEGWTGALTRKHALETVQGHFDEDTSDLPVVIYPHDDIQQAAVGWGCSAFLDTQGQVHMVGRPQDLLTLLRMNRLPNRILQWANVHADPSDTTIVGSFISKLIGLASGGDEQEDWGVAQQFSLLHDWTKLDLTAGSTRIGDSTMSQITCGAGFSAMIGSSGTLYTMGINTRGQCGTGTLKNNLWTPKPVVGLTTSFERRTKQDQVEQDQPIVQVVLGFQHGYALTKLGQVYSWGKAGRGQLGRELEADQDATARLIPMDALVTQVASGLHHGALLTASNQVYIWGKNMARNDSSEAEGEKPKDARIPEPVVGLPLDQKVLQVSCGSHHTAILLEDGSIYAVGIASDEAVPLLDPVQLIASGLLELPLRQFEAHHDRTTAIDNQGQVFQVHLWRDESLRDYAYFTPSYVETLLDEGQSIEAIHRGWLHTIIVTKPI
jgi:alpha-tubulin suppressor-like RCC1 family protein